MGFRSNVTEGRHFRPTLRRDTRAAGRKTAPGRPRARIGRLSRDAVHSGVLGQIGHGGDQGLRVRMVRTEQDPPHRTSFDNPPRIHDTYAMSDRGHRGKVVADIDRSYPIMAAQMPDDIEDARLRRHIKAGRGLVHHNYAWAIGKGHGNCNALLLAPRNLMRIGIQKARRVWKLHIAQ